MGQSHSTRIDAFGTVPIFQTDIISLTGWEVYKKKMSHRRGGTVDSTCHRGGVQLADEADGLALGEVRVSGLSCSGPGI